MGAFTFQPSEFGKVLFVLALAGFVAVRARAMSGLAAPLAVLAYGLPPIILVFVQPDIGTALVYSGALFAILFVAGVRWLHLGILMAVAVLGALAVLWFLPGAGINVLKPYQTARLTGFTHPDNQPQGATYNLRQSITAVGAGGLRGRGLLGATQTRLNYLPEHATDFAFASLAEERGFFGSSILLLLYLLVVWRSLKIVASARDLYCAVVAGGIAFMFLFQVFVNSAMTMGVAPITGIPLPFVSVGGSSMITNFLAIGVLQAIHVRRGQRRHA
jgi:rod shape determining protein RodA